MPKTCKEWIRKKLQTEITGEEFECRLKTNKVVDWFFEENGNLVIIEDKEINDVSLEKAEKQVKDYATSISDDYKNIISIAVKEINKNFHKVSVFINGIRDEKHPHDNLNSLNYYFNLFDIEFDRQELIKNINILNELMHEQNINDNIRASLCCTLLICLSKDLILNDGDSFKVIKLKVKEKLEEFTKNDANKWKKIQFLYEKFKIDINTNISSITEKIVLDIYNFLKNKIWVYLKNDNKNESYDIMSMFFTTFGKKALSKNLGQYFTPEHMSDLMTELLELNVNSKVIDLTCGSGTFLTKCMDKMIYMANNDEEKILNIKQNQIFGIEKDPNIAGLAMANMLLHKDGRSNISQSDCFRRVLKPALDEKTSIEYDTDIENDLRTVGIDRLILNPPYSQKDHSELEFLKLGLDILNTGGIGVIILPTSCVTDRENKEIREELLSQHTLKAVFTAPRELFYPVGTTTCIMVWEAKKPHSGKTYLMDWKNDGFYKKRLAKGCSSMVCDYTNWKEKKEIWLNDYFYEKKLGIFKEFDKNKDSMSGWLYDVHIDVNYQTLSENDFLETLKEYLTYEILNKGDE